MPSAAFASAMPFVLQWEGGYVNHPNDPGGATNRGVTQRVYDDWRRGRGLPARDVRQLVDDEMHSIYEAGYWTPAHCPALADPLALVQFDTAVNMGVGRAVRFTQRAVGTDDDGVWGPGTQASVERSEPLAAARAHCAAREDYYRRLAASRPKLAVFLNGWLNRLNALRAITGVTPRRRGASAVVLEPVARVPDIGIDADYDLDAGDAGAASGTAAPAPTRRRAPVARTDAARGPIRRAAKTAAVSKGVAKKTPVKKTPAKKAAVKKAATKRTPAKKAPAKKVAAKKAATKKASAKKAATK